MATPIALTLVIPGKSCPDGTPDPASCEDGPPLSYATRDYGLVAVADGVSGYVKAREAATTVIGALTPLLAKADWRRESARDVSARITRSLRDQLVREAGANTGKLRGTLAKRWGTTLAAAQLSYSGNTLRLLWIGDSRIYNLDHHALRRLSVDDSTDLGDTYDVLKRGSPMSQFLHPEMDPRWRVHCVDVPSESINGIIVVATDGCYEQGNPWDLEQTLVAAFHRASDWPSWLNEVTAALTPNRQDDCSLAVLPLHSDNYADARAEVLGANPMRPSAIAARKQGDPGPVWEQIYKGAHEEWLDWIREADAAVGEGVAPIPGPSPPPRPSTGGRFPWAIGAFMLSTGIAIGSSGTYLYDALHTPDCPPADASTVATGPPDGAAPAGAGTPAPADPGSEVATSTATNAAGSADAPGTTNATSTQANPTGSAHASATTNASSTQDGTESGASSPATTGENVGSSSPSSGARAGPSSQKKRQTPTRSTGATTTGSPTRKRTTSTPTTTTTTTPAAPSTPATTTTTTGSTTVAPDPSLAKPTAATATTTTPEPAVAPASAGAAAPSPSATPVGGSAAAPAANAPSSSGAPVGGSAAAPAANAEATTTGSTTTSPSREK